jgi:two-component system response regulator YesN
VLSRKDVDVEFVDLIMPHMDGLELMRRMREDFPAVKVVVISAFEEITDLAERQKDVVMTLKKPFTLTDVVDAIKQAIEEA